MKLSTSLLLAASAALSHAQDPPAAFECGVEDGVYCAGDSLGTDIIVRCHGRQPQAGRCGNNLVGYPPLGVNPARCWASDTEPGVAACEKNCIVYGASGNVDGEFALPGCTPYATTNTTAPPPPASTPTSFSVSIPIFTYTTPATSSPTSFSVSLPIFTFPPTTTPSGTGSPTSYSVSLPIFTFPPTTKPSGTGSPTSYSVSLPILNSTSSTTAANSTTPPITSTVVITNSHGIPTTIATVTCLASGGGAGCPLIPTGGGGGGGNGGGGNGGGGNGGGGNGGGSNSTQPGGGGGGGEGGGSATVTATATPVGPTTSGAPGPSSRPTYVPSAASANSAAGVGLVVVGLLMAFAV